MGKNTIRRPDEAAMSRLLAEQKKTAAGLILRLAWRQGLTREEIQRLTWDDVSFPDHQLCLPDRAVPLDRETETCLRLRFERQGTVSPSVVISDRLRRQMPPESISRLARTALDQPDGPAPRLHHPPAGAARLALCGPDQRHCRQHAYACFSGYLPEGRRKTAGRRTEVDAFLLWKLLQTEGSSPVGLALWMSWKLGMQAREIVALTWSQVDLDRGVIHLPDRDLTLGITLRRLLRTAQNRRREGDDPHVLLAPNSRRPIDQPRLSKLVRTALIRGGLETVSLGDLCREERREGEDARLLVYAAEKGAISRSEAMSILGLSKVAAYERLRQLTASGRLVRVGTKYYPAGQVVPPEEQYGVIREFLTQSGPAYRQDLAALLHIGDRQCALILKHMVEAGRLVRTGQRYALPVEEKAIL